MNYFENIMDQIDDCKTKCDVKDVLWKSFVKTKNKMPRTSHLKVALVCIPCHGYGDIVFCAKIAEYFTEWYKCEITILTTTPEKFKHIGCNITTVRLGNTKRNECRRLKKLKLSKRLPVQDLIFIAPLQSDQEPDMRDIQYVFSYSTLFNTFFMSEYNPISKCGNNVMTHPMFDFITGVGDDRYGLLLSTIPEPLPKLKYMTNPYAVAYVSTTVEDASSCALSFIEMVAKKYRKTHKRLDIVISNDVIDDSDYRDIIDVCKPYGTIQIDNGKGIEVLKDTGDSVITLRSGIYPLSRKDMIRLIRNSVRDILVTGDQSLSDVLSCCKSKNIFYHTVGWKEQFTPYLAEYMPNKYLSDPDTACGSLKAIGYSSDYRKFIKEWDFRTLAREKLNCIFRYAVFKQQYKEDIDIIETLLCSKSLAVSKRQTNEYIESLSEYV
jgi:hypothetical protein